MELFLGAIVVIVIIVLMQISSREKELRHCKKTLEGYYLKLAKDEYERRKLYREHYLGKDSQGYGKITESRIIAYLKSKGCNYDRVKKHRIFLRGMPKANKGINDLMLKEKEIHNEFERFLSYK